MKPTNMNEMTTAVRELSDDELNEVTGAGESLTMNFTKIEYSYVPQRQD